jgi:hypothetical protein
MKIGVLATGFNCAEYFHDVLAPWLEYKKNHDLIISAVSARFKGNEVEPDGLAYFDQAYFDKKIDSFVYSPELLEEFEARNLALKPLLDRAVDYIILLDMDELYTLEQIENIFKFVEENPFTTWFKIHFKNYVGDEKHFIDDFAPPRIFKTENLAEAYYDNDFNYFVDGAKVSYKNFSSMQVPRVVEVKHLSWCGSPERLKQKINYQNKHFGFCSYKWNEEKNQIELNLDFYKKYNVPVPTIYEEQQR